MPDAGISPVPECSGTGLRYSMPNADAGGIDLDADAQLCNRIVKITIHVF
jgi:hypothetical protein